MCGLLQLRGLFHKLPMYSVLFNKYRTSSLLLNLSMTDILVLKILSHISPVFKPDIQNISIKFLILLILK